MIAPRDDWLAMHPRRRAAWTDRMLAMYGWRCSLCGLAIVNRADASTEHIKPRSLGGLTTIENCRPAHRLCNAEAGARPKNLATHRVHDGAGFFLGATSPGTPAPRHHFSPNGTKNR